jgi:hypothetical protein
MISKSLQRRFRFYAEAQAVTAARYALQPRSKSGRRSRYAVRWRHFFLQQRTLEAFVARRTRPCHAESGPLEVVPRSVGNVSFSMQRRLHACHDVMFRDSYAPLPQCRISGLLRRRLRQQSPFPRPSEVSHVWWMRKRRAGWGICRVSLPSKFSKLIFVDPLGHVPFCFRVPVGVGVPRGAHPFNPAPPFTAMATPRCTRRRPAAIAESSDC